jgi:hypothetical protein
VDSTALLALFRSEMNDLDAPYLWADADVYRYIGDAEVMFCRKTDGIADASTAAVTQLTVFPGTDWLALHPKLRRIRSVIRSDTGRPLEVIYPDEMAKRGWFFDGRTAPLQALVLGEEGGKARVWPTSSETVTLKLTVFRLPLTTITAAGMTPEVGEEHHLHLLHWVKYLAYCKEDAETFDKQRAEKHEATFLRYCEAAKVEQRRKSYKPGTVAYGGL